MSDQPWIKSYPSEILEEINPDSYHSLVDVIEEAFHNFKDLPAYSNMGKEISFDEVNKLSKDFSAYLQSLGFEPGDRIAIQMPNILQYPVALFGALRAGLTVVNTNPLYTAHEMKHQFKDSGVKAIIILSNFASKLEKIIDETDIEKVIITDLGDMIGGLKGSIVNFVVKYVKKMVPAYNIPGSMKFMNVIKKGASMNYTRPKVEGKHIAFLQYTGGTTGVSKGAVLSHRNMVANILQSKAWFYKIEPKREVIITALPLYHIFALLANCLLMLHVGAKSVLITNPRDIKAFVKDLKKNPFSFITAVNTLFNALLNDEEFRTLDFSNLKFSVGGGMAVQSSVANEWMKLTGNPICEGYGLSETSPVLTLNPINGKEKIGFIGLPITGTDIKIMDEDGNELPVGEPGELCAKGPQVFSGYWKRENETGDYFFGEYFRTGDIAYMDSEGYFKIVDRKKDMINVSGFNVYPNEIEDAISHHEKVLEVAAIGIPHEKSTEIVKVFVVKKDPSLTEEEIYDFCKDRLTNYKRPKKVEFRDELPKSNVGKILRRHLRE